MKTVRTTMILALITTMILIGNNSAQGEDAGCGYLPAVDTLLAQSDLSSWIYWVEVLSGERPAQFDGFPVTIRTRNTRDMFGGSSNARAYDFVHQQVTNWFPENLIIEQPYEYVGLFARNLIVTIPGRTKTDEYILLVAHLDDTSWNASEIAPGANDNAIGAATLLEAARLFRQLAFERSLRMIWFTGEEAGLVGSRAYVNQYENLDYHGVINLDMFGWDGDGDHCFEIHVGSKPASDEIGRCLVQSISAYHHELIYDYLVNNATGGSDHLSFWQKDIGAIALTENFSEFSSENGCTGEDKNPNYHLKEDTIALNLTPYYAYDIARAALEAAASLAVPLADHTPVEAPVLVITETHSSQVSLAWSAIPQAASYSVFQSSFGCQDWGLKVAQTSETGWTDEHVLSNWPYQYRIEALLSDGQTVSPSSNCVTIGPEPPPAYQYRFLSMIIR
jgi:leucyl aminopeptidase